MENLDASTLKAQHLRDSLKGAFPSVLKQLELASGQLSTDQDFHFYSNFKEFKNPVKDIQNRAVSLLSQISALKYFRSSSSSWPADSDEAYDWLVGVQDDLLERVDAFVDKSSVERKGAKQKQPELATFQASASQAMTSPRDVKVARKGKDDTSNRLPVPFHVRSIPRPQDKFDMAPDNSNSRFRHPCPLARKLEYDAVSSAEDFAVDANKDEPEGFAGSTHPLEAELKEMAFMEPILEPIEARRPSSLQDTPFTFVDTLHSLKGMADKLRTAAEIAVDLEHHHYRSYQGFVCLMQVSTRLEDFVVDTLPLRSHIGPCLADIFSDSKILKVIHGADRDIVWLQRDFGIYVCNMFDTGQAARVLELPSAGLAFLLEHFCGVIADKRYQMADWRIRPLPAEMLKYAREDTHYLLHINDLLKQQLVALRSSADFDGEDPLVQVCRRSRDICLQLYKKELFTETSFLHLHGLYDKQFRPDQLAAVAKIYAWRDQMARKDDESTGYVLPNHLLFQLATEMPENVRQLQMIAKGPHSYAGRNAGVLVALIREAKANPLLTPVPPPSKPGMRDSKLQQDVVDKTEVSSALEVGAPVIFTSEDGDEMEALELEAVKQEVEEVSVWKGDDPSQLVPTPGSAVVSRKAGSVFFSSPRSKSIAVETAVSAALMETDVLVAVPPGASGSVGRKPTPAVFETRSDGEDSLANHSAYPPIGLSWNPTDKKTVNVREIAESRTKSASVVYGTLPSSTDGPAQHVISQEGLGDYKEGSSVHEVETGSQPETQPHTRSVPEVKLKRKIKGVGASLFGRSRHQREGVCRPATLPDQVQAKLKAQAVESSIALPFKTTTLVHQAVCSGNKAENPEEMEAPENVDPAVNAPQQEESAKREDQNAVLEDVLMLESGDWTNNDFVDNTTDQETRRNPWSGEESSPAGASGASVDLKGKNPKGVEASETNTDQQNSSFPPSLSEIHQTHRRRKRNRGGVPVLSSIGPSGATGAPNSDERTGQRKKSKVDQPNSSKVIDLDACAVNGSFSYAEARKRLGVDNLYAARVDEQKKSGRRGKFNKKPITSNKTQSLGFDALRRVRVDPKPEGIPKAPRRQVYSMTGNRSATFKK